MTEGRHSTRYIEIRMTMRFRLACGKCHHQFSCVTTPEEYRQLIKTLQMDATCPRAACRAVNHVCMTDTDTQVVSWSPPRKHQPADGPPESGHIATNESPQSSVKEPMSSNSKVAFPTNPASADARPPESFPQSTSAPQKRKPDFEWGVINDAHGRKPTLQKFLDRFSELPQAVQYSVLALLFGLAIIVLLYEPSGTSNRPQSDKSTASEGTKTPPKTEATSVDKEL